MKELLSGIEQLPEFQGMGENVQTILEKFVKIDSQLFLEIIEKSLLISWFNAKSDVQKYICTKKLFLFMDKDGNKSISKVRHFDFFFISDSKKALRAV